MLGSGKDWRKKTSSRNKRIGHTEKRKVRAALHKISRAIVNEAKRYNAIIVLGNLKGIRES